MRSTPKKTALTALVILLVFTSYGWAQFDEPTLQVGDWVQSETWHNWFGGEDATSKVRLHVHDFEKVIDSVEFYYSIDMGITWTLFDSDDDGHEPAITTVTASIVDTSIFAPGDGWTVSFPHNLLPQIPMMVLFRAIAYIPDKDPLIIETEYFYDPTPPGEITISFSPIINDTTWITINDIYHNIDLVTVFKEPKQDSFAKGIPGISQQPHSNTHCVPTAAAACLKYFEGNGDDDICGGLDEHDLVDSLAEDAGTNQEQEGTMWDDIVNTLEKWIRDHGDNYTLRSMDFDWETARNELERCQDVIMSIDWPGGGWHMMTFNSIVNTPNFDGTIRVDFMDPWTGQIEWGDLDPETGELSGFSGAGSSGTMSGMIIICPKESDPTESDDPPITSAPGPDPVPIAVPLVDTVRWFINVVVIDMEGNTHRFINIVPDLSTALNGNIQETPIPNFYLAQNTPNPFNDETNIAFALPAASDVTVSIYDATGRKINTLMTGELPAGVHHVTWDGTDGNGHELPSGTYFCELSTKAGFKQTTRMLLVR